ncbi:MAG TPA: hypothetical protein VMC02_14480 [Steroidobacteraceae bacterium]|nr:hypothetical protein [Steroidobacteraceae bacterium]
MKLARYFEARFRDCQDYLRFALTDPELKLEQHRKGGRLEPTPAHIDGLCRAIDDYGKAGRIQRAK